MTETNDALWGEFRADHCTGYGLRQYSARLWDIQGSWEDACDNAPAVIKRQRFDKPNRCVNKGVSGIWGEFDVNDISCIPYWGDFRKDHSTGDGLHQYSSRLWDLRSELDWEEAAKQTPATIKGQYFSQPTRVKQAGIAEVWGEFDVKDESNLSPGDGNDLSNWIEVKGENSYCYCVCNSAGEQKESSHPMKHTMKIDAGAPYFYAVLTKDDDTIDFPTDAVLTIEGPEGTKYDRDIQEENQLVIMSGSSIRCLIIKDPKPGDWKMTMTVPEGVGFHCECNTVPSKDPYKTITTALSKTNQLQKRGSSKNHSTGWTALAGLLTTLGGLVAGVTFWPIAVATAVAMVVTNYFASGQSNVAIAVENQITGVSPSQPTTTAMATALANTAQASATATLTPVVPNAVRVATWNVFPRNIRATGTTPMGRILTLLTETVREDFDIVVFQEVPESLLRQLEIIGSNERREMDNVIRVC
jgi:hypothetical protein